MNASKKILVIQDDITTLEVDAIVNAANAALAGGGGVDGAIHRAGGPDILQECQKIVKKQGLCPTGGAVITTAGALPSKYVIHTVGPIWDSKNDRSDQLFNCYWNSLQLATEHRCQSVAFPNISTGIYGYPKPEACRIAFRAINKYLSEVPSMKKVILCCFDMENYELAQKELQRIT